MKLHLPLNLYRALLLALCAVPALLHADNSENVITIENTGNSPSVGYTNINGDIQYTDSFIRENNQKGLKINTLVFEELMNVVFYKNSSYLGAFNCDEGSASFIGNDNITFQENVSWYDGGAVQNQDNGTIIFSDNGNIHFKQNSGRTSNGGALSNRNNSLITLSSNENISFEGNSLTGSYSEGGAIYNKGNSTITLSDNGNIIFEENRITGKNSNSGGAIKNDNSAISFCNNDNITFERNSVTSTSSEISVVGASGGAIENSINNTITFSNNANVSFKQNSAASSGEEIVHADGGAIFSYYHTATTFNNNTNISFEGNSVTSSSNEDPSARGGAIYSYYYSTTTFSDNTNINILGNSATSTGTKYTHASGGAIYGYSDSTITFNNNRSIIFERNSVTSSGEESSYAEGGAIYNYYDASATSFSNNRNITFEGNSATCIGSKYSHAQGGAIYNRDTGTITFNNNGNISFIGNNVTSIGDKYTYAHGGAIYNWYEGSLITFSNNANITFAGNSATSTGTTSTEAQGGAIFNWDEGSLITFSNNANITFAGNRVTNTSVENSYSHAEGGAIYNDNDSSIAFSDNGSIAFEGNSATSNCEVSGGAIYNWGDLSLIGNKDITFQGNSVTGTGEDSAQGGAIYNWGDLSLIGNKDITFQGNSVTGTGEDSAQGGAIYNGYVDLILSNNGNVLFEKNIEKSGNSYRLRSIYSGGGHLILGAADHKKIEFRDSIYSGGKTSFNADYVDESGNTIKQIGDVIFTGAYTEEHLKEAKGGIAGTAEEILASRTSELGYSTALYGGRLRIEDGAIIKGSTLDVAENANATVLLRHGTLDLGSYSLDISANSTLSAIGENTINAGIYISKGGTLQLALDMSQVDSAAVLTTTGALNMRNIAFDLTGTEYLVAGDYKLLTRTEGTNYDISGWTLTGVSAEQLRWENGTLYYTGGHTWNHEVTDNPDSYVTENLYGNLIINGGDMTLNNLIGAIQDKDAAGYGHGNGHIVINRGNIHLAGAGEFDGKIIFNGDFNYIRNLFIEKDLSGVEIELNGSTAAANNVNVDGEHTMEIENIYGEGSINKTGEGEMVIHGHGHKIGGMMHVQEGSVTFTAGSSASAHGDVTEINELVVGNHEEKIAKVKVDEDTKIQGHKLHLNGKNAVVTNEGTMEVTGEVTVEAGHLNNQGSISKVTLEGGTVSGSGSFDGFEMNGGKLIVGNSLGLQAFTDAVELNEGMIIFSLSDAATAATAETFGWDSAAYSTMDLGGNALTLSENVDFVLEIGGHALESLVAEDGATLTFSLNLIQNIASESLTLDEEAFATLLDNTKIIITADAEGLSDSMLQLAGIDITEMLSNAEYSYEGNTLVLSGTVTNDGSLTIPEPTTATLSLLALAALAARRRRK